MSPTHHPSGQALANFLVGDCSPGASLLIARHVKLCLHCSSMVQAMGSVGVECPPVVYGEVETLQPGVEIATVAGVSGLGEAVYCVRAAAEASLPQNAACLAVEILVLEGGLDADGISYRTGDYLSLEETPRTRLSAAATGCVYLKVTHTPASPATD